MRIRGTAERSHKLKRLEGIRIDIEGRNFPLAISAGWAELLRGQRARELLARADAELYASKRAKYAAQSQPVPAKRPPGVRFRVDHPKTRPGRTVQARSWRAAVPDGCECAKAGLLQVE